jgi:predicted CXXCH cytochrome family protein
VKSLFAATILVGALVVLFGSPIASEKPVLDHYYDAPKKILPMSFAHLDHVPVNCVDCHHNYVDDSGGGLCMNCHVTDQAVWPLLENQFHDLCRGCHEEKAALGEAGGPPRECMACHLGDDLP